ncbi:T9SS type A sorting domain-containing protein [Ferruginibacter albus]|uniref:T9SS type A sorting domain-containing protein n=1 Tax=Ferruginibacter albus TaxID=2875540 RepID=UPI001CC75AA9|nr:T9SS type A sorting domain-containing protein [Ferruginibacter albus]UAY52025.1 T9SS type A sorting domain-containing protein [Ferruginibacter albus]
MKNLLLLFFTSLCFDFANSQAPAIQWKKTFGSSWAERAYSTQPTKDGGCIVAGYANYNEDDVTGNHGGDDFWVVKLSFAGVIQWQQCYGGSYDDIAYSIQQTTDGGYIIAGSTLSSDGQVTGFHRNLQNPLWEDYWVVKIDSIGELQWQKTLGGTGFDEAYSVAQTLDGGYIVAGVSNSGDGDFVNGGNIVKLSSTGEIQWHHYQGGNFNYSVQQASDGGYIIAGALLGQFSILKIDSLGYQQWWKFYGGSGPDVANSVKQTRDGGYIVAGYTQSGDVTGYHGGSSDAWVIKLDSMGELQWNKALGGSYVDQANSIEQTTDGGYIIAGITNSNDGDASGYHGTAGAYSNTSGVIPDYWVVKISDTGKVQWQKTMGSSYLDYAYDVKQTTDGGYVVVGSTVAQKVNDDDVTGFHLNVSLPNASGYDYWIVKLAPDVVTPVQLISFTAIAQSCNVALLNWKTAQEINNKGFDIEQSTDGHTFYKVGFEAAKATNNNGLVYNFNCNNLIYGQTYFRLKQIDIDGSFEYSSIVSVKNYCTTSFITIFPNPASNSVHITGLINSTNNIKLTNESGATIKNWINTPERDFDISSLAKGIYFITIENKSYKFSKE